MLIAVCLPAGARPSRPHFAQPGFLFDASFQHRAHGAVADDLLGFAALGRELYALVPGRPDAKPRLLASAGSGVIGSPSVSYDGKTIYFTMAPAGASFLHLYRVNADGSGLEELTHGPFHDYDPCPLPDGRIAFSSTRIGSREEYHGNLASSLFVMETDGSGIKPLTYHIVADREPKVTATGSIVFVRSDNFLERAKVETQIHHVRPDGTGGVVVLGGDRGVIPYNRPRAAENNSRWLRQYGFGSPAPLPDGRVAAISSFGLVISGFVGGGQTPVERVPAAVPPFDISPLPDGRLLCTASGHGSLGVLDTATGDVTRLYSADTFDLHSVVYLGPRPHPPSIAPMVNRRAERRPDKTGFLVCQSIYYTKQTDADRARIKALRIYEGRPLAIRSARHQYNHIGVESVELGTVPVAPDGSFHVEVPADRALAMQAVDAEGRPVINEISWIYVRPGERRTCVGCHSQRPSAPSMTADVLAARFPPVKLLGQGEPHRYRGNNAANGGVLNLQLDRFREAAAINLYPQEPLDQANGDKPLPAGRPARVQALCKQLADGETAPRVAAARRLALFRDRGAVPALVQALSDPSVEVRVAAAMALAACGNREAVPGLLDALGDERPHVAQAAHVALEHLTGHPLRCNAFVAGGGAAGAKAWRSWLDEHDWAAIEAARIEELAADDPIMVRRAVEALGHVGGDAARAALRDYVSSHPDAELRLLMAALRAIGHLGDPEAVSLLAQILNSNLRAKPKNPGKLHELGWTQRPVYLAATAAEALGWIATPEAEAALIGAVPRLLPFWKYTFWTGDHSWLMGCHSSVVHFRILEALDAMGSTRAKAIVPHLLRSVPIDTDRGLLLENDAYETLVARVAQRAGLTDPVLETCLAVLGDKEAKADKELQTGVVPSPPASSCKPLAPAPRAAQIASVVALDARHAARLRAALGRFRATKASRQRSWTCFFLARALGKVRAPGSADALIACLEDDPPEATLGLEAPPNVFVYKAMTPFHRAAAAYGLGLIGRREAAPVLLATVADLDNAVDVRHAAAQGLRMLGDPATLPRLTKLADDYPEVATRRILLQACARALKD
ncbi:MAG: HEAT repeat domain-containing protein [Planctomycetota bacterium]